MKTTKKIIKIAKSCGVIIDKPLLEKLNLNQGDFIEIDIKKV